MSSLVQILDGVTAPNGAPSGNVGVELPEFAFHPTHALFLMKATCTAAQDASVTAKLWLYHGGSAGWYPAGTNATAANKGLLNGGEAMGETGTDVIMHVEEVQALYRITKVYLELVAAAHIASLTAWLDYYSVR